MESRAGRQLLSTRVVRWVARLWTIGSIGLILVFLVGERSYPQIPAEWLGFLFFPFGISVGMILAWWREGIGGTIAVGSLVLFYVIHLTTAGTLPRGWAWLLFVAPGFLFLLCWFRSRRTVPAAA